MGFVRSERKRVGGPRREEMGREKERQVGYTEEENKKEKKRGWVAAGLKIG
jgi:hypothetical protein